MIGRQHLPQYPELSKHFLFPCLPSEQEPDGDQWEPLGTSSWVGQPLWGGTGGPCQEGRGCSDWLHPPAADLLSVPKMDRRTSTADARGNTHREPGCDYLEPGSSFLAPGGTAEGSRSRCWISPTSAAAGLCGQRQARTSQRGPVLWSHTRVAGCLETIHRLRCKLPSRSQVLQGQN